jgi:hypothetical protein
LVIGVGKAVVGFLAGKVMKGNRRHRVSKGGKVSTVMGRGGGGKEVRVGFLEAAVDVAAEVGKA